MRLQKSKICPYPVKYLQDNLRDITTGDFIMVCANTGTGKSTISRLFADNAIANDCPVVLYSLEDEAGMPFANACYQLGLREGRCQGMDLKQWLLENTENPAKYASDRQRVYEQWTQTTPKGDPYFVLHENVDGEVWTLDKVVKQMTIEIANGYRLFIIDHIDVLVPSELPSDMVTAMRRLWDLVAEKQVALITFSQLASRRNLDSLCPGLDDLRGSKAKVQTPTIVISISRHRYGYYQARSNPTSLRILKNRFGRTGCGIVYFDRGRYDDFYTNADCNESGTYIDGMTAKDLARLQRRQQ